MPIESLLVQLADVITKIENARALLQPTGHAPVMDREDREHVEAMLVRLTAKKTELEDQLRKIANRG